MPFILTQRSSVSVFLFFCFYNCFLSAQSKFVFPTTAKNSHTINYYGTLVTEDYSWLENRNDTNVQKWIEKQSFFTDSFFNDVPYLSKLEKNIKDKGGYYLDFPAIRKKYSFNIFTKSEWSFKKDYEKSVPILYYREKNNLQWEELINPLKYRTAPDENIILTNYVLSGHENYLAFSISRNGSDWNEIHILDMNSKKILNEVIVWVKNNHIIWCKDGFFYQRYENPPKGLELVAKNNNEQLYYHQLKTQVAADIILPVQNCQRLEVLDADHLIIYAIETIKNKSYYTVSTLSIKSEDWNKQLPKRFIAHPSLTRYNVDVLSIRNDSAIVRNNFLADNGMIAYFNVKGMNEFNTVVPQYNEVLVSTFYYLGKLHCLYKNDTSYMMARVNLKGEREKFYEFGKFMTVSNFELETKKTAYYREYSFDRPTILNRFNFESYESGMVAKTSVKYELNDYVIKKVEYKSSDGTSISMNLFYKKGLKINENTPVLLSAYGGFGIITSPSYDYSNILWAENGGIYAEAYIRGGGEKGKKWHVAGSGKNKQQSISDFIYAAKFLIEHKYTRPEKLAITGSSHGGLIVAAAANQQPGLFKAVIPVVGVFDMLNYQNYTIGDYISDEFGTISDSLSFLTLYKYSPIHNIKNGATYPATFVMTGDHDDRVPPFNSYKYVASLQQKTDKTNTVLLYVNTNSGHHGAFTRRDAVLEKTYLLSFLFKIMGIDPVLIN